VTRLAGPDLPGLLEAADWLRHNTPETRGYFEAKRSDGSATRPEYGVLARSGSGHVLEYRARRPTLSNGFGDDIGIENFERVREYFWSVTEAAGLAIADALTARYVLVDAADPAARESAATLARRLSVDDGSGLARHRLVFETSILGRGASARVHKIFEIVPGARVVGRAPPGAVVGVRLDLRTNRKRKVVYRASSRANRNGEYALHLPYSTERALPRETSDDTARCRSDGSDGSCRSAAASAYRIEVADRSAVLEIEEAQIQRGATLPGPDFGS
jgi:hypothetical protein